jgi:Holliday junction resolvase RusA-like endonuclease
MTAWTLKDIEKKGLRVRETLRPPPSVASVTLDLPIPPSVNGCWANIPGTGRVRSQVYRRWHKTAFDEIVAQGAERVAGPYTAEIEVGRIRARADIDNRIKPTLDLLAGLVTDDDAKCESVLAKWSDAIPSGRLKVTVRKAA